MVREAYGLMLWGSAPFVDVREYNLSHIYDVPYYGLLMSAVEERER